MSNNANPQAITFANNKVRPVIDAAITFYQSALTLQTEWNAQDIVAIIPSDSNPIQDGATTASGSGAGSGADGRPPITDSQVNIFISNITTLLAPFTANSNLILNQTMAMMVNGKSVI